MLFQRIFRFSAVHSLLAATISTTSRYSSFAVVAAQSNKSAAFVIPASGVGGGLSSSSTTTTTTTTTRRNSNHSITGGDPTMTFDKEYPGTAVERMFAVRERVAELKQNNELSGMPWEEIRRKILWAGGLRDLPDAIPGKGYTGHSFNDYNHVDLTCMAEAVSDNENDGKVYREIARGNLLGPGIRTASLPELGPGGSWSTCANGCNLDPPQDVAHIQFRARVAFKLVWVPNERYDTFVLVDDDGKELARGKPTEGLPGLRQRQMNYAIMQGSKYAVAAEKIATNVAAE